MITETEARSYYAKELDGTFGITDFHFTTSRVWKNGVLVEQRLNVTFDEKGNKEAIEYLKGQDFEAGERKKKYVRGYDQRYANGAGYQITLSLKVQPMEDKDQ